MHVSNWSPALSKAFCTSNRVYGGRVWDSPEADEEVVVFPLSALGVGGGYVRVWLGLSLS